MDISQQDVVGKVCPKCHYKRKADEAVPETRCPRCRILYAKAEAEVVKGEAEPDTEVQMAASGLVSCSDCGHQISPKAKSCPSCGAPRVVKQGPTAGGPPQDFLKATEAVLKSVIGLIVVVGVLTVFFGGDEEENPESTAVQEQRILTPKELRQQRIEEQFSGWDGSHRNLEKYIKRFLNDPDSYEHSETRYNDKGSYLEVLTIYRAKNGFGAMRLGAVKAKVSLDGEVMEILDER